MKDREFKTGDIIELDTRSAHVSKPMVYLGSYMSGAREVAWCLMCDGRIYEFWAGSVRRI